MFSVTKPVLPPRGCVIFNFIKTILVEFSSPQINSKKRLKTIVVNRSVWRWPWWLWWLYIILVIIYYLELTGGGRRVTVVHLGPGRAARYDTELHTIPLLALLHRLVLRWWGGGTWEFTGWCWYQSEKVLILNLYSCCSLYCSGFMRAIPENVSSQERKDQQRHFLTNFPNRCNPGL